MAELSGPSSGTAFRLAQDPPAGRGFAGPIRPTAWGLAQALWEVTKPRVVALLVMEAAAGGFLAAGPSWPRHAGGIIGGTACVWLGASAAEALTNTIDRDIDGRMARTRARALPARRLSPAQALVLGCVLLAAALVLAVPLGVWTGAFLALGVADNVVVYSLLTKRRTPWSGVLGAFSGGAPALIGYAAVSGGVAWPGVLLAMVVMVWTPLHVWSLGWRHGADYAVAGVPVPSNVWPRESVAVCIAGAAAAVAWLGLGLALGLHQWLPLGGSVAGAVALAGPAWRLWRRRDLASATAVFRSSNLYLAVLLLTLILGAALAATWRGV